MRRNSRWTKEEEQYLGFAYSTTELDELVKELGRTKTSISDWLGKKWTGYYIKSFSIRTNKEVEWRGFKLFKRILF